MSRFQQITYQKVLKEPRRRYLLKKKEKLLWKSYPLKTQLKAWSFLVSYIIIFLVLLFTLKPNETVAIAIVLAWAIGAPFIALLFSEDKREKAKKNQTPMSLSEFIDNSKQLNDISNINNRAIRQVLGSIYEIKPCQIHPTDTPENLAYLTRGSCSPLAFEIIVGVANQLSISLSEQNIDQITDNICDCANVEELIVKLSKELEQRRGRHCDNAIDFSQLPKDDDKENLWRYLIGGFVLFVLVGAQALLERARDIKELIEPFGLLCIFVCGVIGSLLGLGVGLLKNRRSKKAKKLSIRKCVIIGIFIVVSLVLLDFVGEEDLSKSEMTQRVLWSIIIGGIGGWVWGKLSNWKPKKVSEDDRKLWDAISAIGMYGEASRYLSFLLNSMSIGESITIRESESLPEYEMEDLERLPCFSEICAYLKPTMEIEDRFYEQPIQGELISCVRDKQSKKKQYNHTVTICDGIEDAYITFQRNDKEKLGTSNC